MYAETSLRDGFAIRNPEYYEHAWGDFLRSELAQPFIAFVEEQPIAALIVYRFGETVTFMYGMSREVHREKMPNYLLQWEAIRWAKKMGCRFYDFWGAPDWLDPQDPMWGVYRFKHGFGAKLVRTIGAWDYPARTGLYGLYSVVKPRLMGMLRFRGRLQTQQQID
jgi:lipid II:glycine glycyltransferase (peptidoglycan interpeptide bridge formation enzyme)